MFTKCSRYCRREGRYVIFLKKLSFSAHKDPRIGLVPFRPADFVGEIEERAHEATAGPEWFSQSI